MTLCASFPSVRAAGPSLSVTANPSQRFFVGGFVYSDSAMLSRFDAAKFEAMILTAKQQGQSVVRWNCFLKGLDLTFGPDGLVAGVKRGGFEAVRAGLDIAQSHGILLQLVLATAHFLRCGWGGCENTLMNVKNSDRVARNHIMMATPRGVAAYLENIVDPLMSSIGRHNALFGFLVLNEGYFLVRPQDNLFTFLADEVISLLELRRFVNRVAGRIRRRLPGVLLSASLKVIAVKHEKIPHDSAPAMQCLHASRSALAPI